jgi:ParB-like chromosome segregation protein Spo0J
MSIALATGNVLVTPTEEARLVRLHVDSIRPSPVNSEIYRPVTDDDTQIIKLARSIKRRGLLQPLTVSQDLYIINGHQRQMACRLAGVETVLCEVRPITLNDPEFLTLLRESNLQRVKSFDEIFRELVVDINPELAHRYLLQHRKEACAVSGDRIHIMRKKSRKAISKAKREMLDRAIAIINAQQEYWPLSDRSITTTS